MAHDQRRTPLRLHAHHAVAKECLAAPPRFAQPETEAVHNCIGLAGTASETMRRLPGGLNTVPPRAPRCGGCVLTPPSTRRCPKTGRTHENKLSRDLDDLAPFMNVD